MNHVMWHARGVISVNILHMNDCIIKCTSSYPIQKNVNVYKVASYYLNYESDL